MGFNAGSAIEPIGYDFTKYGGGVGETPEPSPERLAEFWQGWSRHVQANLAIVEDIQKRMEAATVDGKTDEAAVDAIRQEFDDRQLELTDAKDERRCRVFAAVCSDQPSYEELRMLPGRILDAWEEYLLGELTPKGRRNDTSD